MKDNGLVIEPWIDDEGYLRETVVSVTLASKVRMGVGCAVLQAGAALIAAGLGLLPTFARQPALEAIATSYHELATEEETCT